jgi:hypothetical protein
MNNSIKFLRDQLSIYISYANWRVLSPVKNPRKTRDETRKKQIQLKSEFYITKYLKRVGSGSVYEIIEGAFPIYRIIKPDKIIKDVVKLEKLGILKAEGKFGHERYSLIIDSKGV